MKITSVKKIAVSLIAVLIAVAGAYYVVSLRKSTPEFPAINPAFSAYINSYTTGNISSGAALRIVLTGDVVDSSRVGQPVSDDLFSFSPAVRGSAYWVDRRTVEFRPDHRMTSGQRYRAKFRLSALVDNLPSDLRTFEYVFRIIPQDLEVGIINVKPVSRTQLAESLIEGSFNTADFADREYVEKSLKAFQEGKELKLSWNHAGEGTVHHFVVQNVARKEQAGQVRLEVNGKPIGVDRTEELHVDIPAVDEFKLMNVRVVQAPNQHVVLQFSDPVKENQNLTGLITISGLSSLDFDVHDNEIRVYPP